MGGFTGDGFQLFFSFAQLFSLTTNWYLPFVPFSYVAQTVTHILNCTVTYAAFLTVNGQFQFFLRKEIPITVLRAAFALTINAKVICIANPFQSLLFHLFI
jgi:hypothetical protein